ncbi:MAG: hypothetical protein AAFY58_04985 [Planctomycetota bacterium]
MSAIDPLQLNGSASVPTDSTAERAHQRALDVAEQLERERRISEARLAELKQDDVLKSVTGTSALERAVAEARHIADELERAVKA